MENNNDTLSKERNVVSFKEVHEELENESMFLKKAHDVKGYKKKADFLRGAGFSNSIASKLYSSISENSHMIEDYERRYHGQYKFILKPQLERLCEKYNLFVREPGHFLGDIPENNIKEMMNFQVYLSDLEAPTIDRFDINYARKKRGADDGEVSYSNKWDFKKAWEESGRMGTSSLVTDYLIDFGLLSDHVGAGSLGTNPLNNIKVPMNELRKCGFGNVIQIAAVEDLLDPDAFRESKARILGRAELNALNQVDLDPIVLCETRHGYIVVTAWGDEANDELIVNQNKN